MHEECLYTDQDYDINDSYVVVKREMWKSYILESVPDLGWDPVKKEWNPEL